DVSNLNLLPRRVTYCKNALVERIEDYEHSSAAFYMGTAASKVALTSFLQLQDVDLTRAVEPQSP
ncbi:hypothetical protein, partial [Pedobacter sp. SYSU D00535]|uniref:hypothetical protein n=1 Tax=Pedobacter sp. SYSU D00535 TaxID=2810308 RepID=UPI001A9584DE